MENKNNTWVWVVVVLVVALAAVAYYYYGNYAPAPSETIGGIQESTDAAQDAALAAEIEALDVGNLDAELQDIDKELAQ